jgi:glutamate dehydrogenase (NAD(P)+)
VLERYSVGPDLNTKLEELGDIARELGIPSVKMAIAKAQGLDLRYFLERYRVLGNSIDHVTLSKVRSGFGLAAACLGVLEFLEIPRQKATVAIQGFGGLGSGAAYSLHKFGVKIVGLSDEEKSLISTNEDRLDIKALIRDSTDGLIPKMQGNGRYEDRSHIYDRKCDVLVPAAIENAVVVDNAGTISVKAVVPGANLAITKEAERLLHERDIIAIPDFVAGCGGSLSMDGLFGPSVHPSAQNVLDHVDKRMRTIVKEILARSQEDGITPREAALSLCSEATIYPEARPYGPLDE